MIKRVGGLDELEKQLQARLNLTQRISVDAKTTVSPISQSLYNKVIGTKRGSEQTEPLIQRKNKEQRYTTLFRNGRPAPQNDGIQTVPEVEGGGTVHERPKYTTITRTQAPKVAGEDVDVEDEEETAGHDDGNVQEAGEHIKTPSKYVNIQRTRSSTAAPEEDDESDDEIYDDETTDGVNVSSVTAATPPRMQYVNIQRIRPTKPQYYAEYFDSTSSAPAEPVVPSSSAAPESK